MTQLPDFILPLIENVEREMDQQATEDLWRTHWFAVMQDRPHNGVIENIQMPSNEEDNTAASDFTGSFLQGARNTMKEYGINPKQLTIRLNMAIGRIQIDCQKCVSKNEIPIFTHRSAPARKMYDLHNDFRDYCAVHQFCDLPAEQVAAKETAKEVMDETADLLSPKRNILL